MPRNAAGGLFTKPSTFEEEKDMLELNLPRQFNAAAYFIDRHEEEGRADKTALIHEETRYTYREVRENVNRCANMMTALGLRMEERVFLLLKDTPEMIFSFYGAIKAGAVPIPGNILMKGDDFLYMLNDSRARLLVVDAAFLPEIEKIRSRAHFLEHILVVGDGASPYEDFKARFRAADTGFSPAPTTPDDAAFWLYSGRNPERPMAAVHHHSHMVYCSRAYAQGILGMSESDRIMGSFLFFAYGLGNGVYFPFFAGGTSILFSHPPKPERVYADLVKYRPTLFFTVPTLLGALADYKRACREKGEKLAPVEGLRACISSAEILSPDIYRRFKDEFGVEVLEGTGSTEICHIFLSSRFDAVRPGSTGKIVPGYAARLMDDDGHPVGPGKIGNLLIRGGSIASAYWNQREETKRNMQGEWFVTGDRYMMDEDGFFFFRGRSDDMLRVGGKWLSPLEVEKAVDSHPAVFESAVVGSTDKDGLVKPYAFVVLAAGNAPSEVLKTQIQAHVKARIAAYKYPRWIEFIDAIPKTPGGKIRRYALQENIRKKDTPC